MTTQWRQVFTSVVLASLLLAISPPVLSFGTINKLGQHDEHEHITRAALACRDGSSGDCFEPLSMDQLAGSPGKFGGVGAPDAFPFHEDFRAHCDNADFFDSATYTPSEPYPVSREAATATLGECVTHLQTRFGQGIDEAKALLNSEDRISKEGVDIAKKSCTFAPSFKGRAKCNVIEGIGRMLHGIQDFYSHSNWADSASPPFTYKNPPGLGRSAPACLLSMRRAPWGTFNVPYDLSTGCYDAVVPDSGADEGGTRNGCLGRVTHDTLNKDKGLISVVDGSTDSPKGLRGEYGNNFRDAVHAAINETQRQWRDFRAELERKYGARRSSLMICALTRDDPITSCQGRKMAIVIDSSGSNGDTDPSNLRIAAAKDFNALLVTNADAGPDGLPDRVTVVDFDSSARVIYPLGDPSAASFLGIDSSGGTYIAGGVATAIGELTKDPNDLTANRTGIILLTDGEDSDTPGLVAQINRAGSLGIRVAYGVLSPSAQKNSALGSREIHRREPPAELVTAILKTGGMFSKIYSAETQKAFIDLVVTHGPTNLDNAKGSNDGVPLTPGLDVSGLVSASAGPDIFTYHGFPGDKLNITIQSMKNQPLKAVLFDIRANILVVESTTDNKGKIIIPFSVFNETDFDLIISTDANEVVYSVSLEKTPGSVTEFSSSVSSSTSSTSSNSPGPELSLSTALSRPTPLSPSISPSTNQTPSPPSSTSLTSSAAAGLQLITSQQVTICSTYWTTMTANNPSSTIAHRRRKLAASQQHSDGLAMAASLPADSRETETSTGVFAFLISVIGVQSALILGSLIWWSCFAKGQPGTTLQGDGGMGYILEWIVPWASRHGYSKPGDGNASSETEKK